MAWVNADSPASGNRAGYDGAKKRKGSKVHLAVDTLGHLLALHVTPANEQDREQVAELTQTVQEVTGGTVEVAFVDQGYTGERRKRRRRLWHGAGGGQAYRGKEGLYSAATTLGRGTQLCLDGARLRATCRYLGRLTFCRLCLPHTQ